jgi:hypothetical protein
MSKNKEWLEMFGSEEERKKHKEELNPPPGICAHCGNEFPQTQLSLLSNAIMRHKPTCSYECNKVLGQAD